MSQGHARDAKDGDEKSLEVERKHFVVVGVCFWLLCFLVVAVFVFGLELDCSEGLCGCC